MRELTLRGVAAGSILGIIFAASSTYLGLKVGLTVSASIPVAVLSITLFRWVAQAMRLRPATILENNIVQTTGSAGESIAAGVAFTLPSLLLMGFDLELMRIMLVAGLGGLIGVLMMIPLRHGLIVREHGRLMYPEGTACADVLIVGEQGGTNARTVFLGFFVGLFYTILNLILKLWADAASFAAGFWGQLKGATLAVEVSPPLLGVGYIIGPRVAANMMAGGALAFLILIPLIHAFGDAMPSPMFPESAKRIADMSPGEIRNAYILYVGAGAVAAGGFIALARAIPTIVGAFVRGLRSLRPAAGEGAPASLRTENDLPMSVVVGGSLALTIAIAVAPVLQINFLSAVLIVLFGFFFVTVSSRITGEIGSSSNPISGMTVATLLITCGLFVLIGWTGVDYKAMALTTAALVCVAAANGGTISQDLKTGFLVGATPRHQQVSILVGVVTSAIVIGYVLLLLNQGHTSFKPIEHPGFTAPVSADAETMQGPDDVTYHVHYLREDSGGVARGKYLADADGNLTFLVDPGVCGTWPYRMEAVDDPAAVLDVPPDAPTELGIDRKPYRVVELTAARGSLSAGTYLVDERGEVAYARFDDKWKFDAPKAQLFRLIIDGTLGGELPWGLVLCGVFLAIMMELVGVSSLPFAVGLYLPISTSGGIFVGGLVRKFVDWRRGGRGESEFSPGMLMASGLIAGGAIAGVVQSIVAFQEKESMFDIRPRLNGLVESLGLGDNFAANHTWWPMLWFLGMTAVLLYVALAKPARPSGPADT